MVPGFRVLTATLVVPFQVPDGRSPVEFGVEPCADGQGANTPNSRNLQVVLILQYTFTSNVRLTLNENVDR